MGRGGQGRPSKPTPLKVLHGDRKDRVNSAEPQPAAGPVVPPDGLSDAALSVWAQLAPDLERQGVLTAWDVPAFAVVCDAVARHRKASEILDLEGETGSNRFGERVVRPWFRVWCDTAAVLAKLGARFGLTPSDRASLKVGAGESSDTKGDLLSG